MRRILVGLVLCVFALTGCDENPHSYDNHLLQNIKYVRDDKTGLCFAYAFHGVSIGLTIVPCHDVIDHLSNLPTAGEVLATVATDDFIDLMKSQLPQMEQKAVTASIFK